MRTVQVSSVLDLYAAMSDDSVDVIEMEPGTYSFPPMMTPVDRTRPLTINGNGSVLKHPDGRFRITETWHRCECGHFWDDHGPLCQLCPCVEYADVATEKPQ